jgi:hypothetical protein
MLSDSERVKLREIEKTLVDDPEFVRSFRKVVPAPTQRSQMFGELAAWAVLLAAVLVIVGAYGAAVFITAGAVALGVTSHIERCAPSRPTDPRNPDRTGI